MRLPDPEKVAGDLLGRVDRSGPPVDVMRLAGLWPDLRVSLDTLDGEGYLIDLGRMGGEIVVRAESIPSRQRYTIAHELGHWVLRDSWGVPLDSGRTDSAAGIEKWCDQFAAALLMPRKWVIRDIETAGLEGFLRAVRWGPDSYEVSNQAFHLRVAELTPISVFELRQERDAGIGIEREYPSTKVDKGPLSVTLLRVMDVLSESRELTRYFDDDTRFLSLHWLSYRGSEACAWMACIAPGT